MNFITRVRGENGQWIEDEEGIRNSTTQYFAKLFASEREGRSAPVLDGTLPSVSQEDNELMHRLPTLEELKEVVFSMPMDSASGPDGFGAGFYQGCWDIIHEDLLLAIQDFFKGAQQPRGFTSAMIILIPKVVGTSPMEGISTYQPL